jgi:MbtH protein
MSDIENKRVDAYTIDGDLFIALINEEEQYSIWPAKKEVPAGWKPLEFSGSKAEVSAYIDQQWTDMRPASLRRAMDSQIKH